MTPRLSMKIQDMSNAIFDASNEDDVERILLRRYDQGVNAFWLYHETRENPWLLILVKDQLANLNYFPDEENHPGYATIGNIPSLPADGYTVFFMNNPKEEEEVPNDAIVPFADALAAAKEFLMSTALPPSIEWFEL
jgi:Immunity protein Imm1